MGSPVAAGWIGLRHSGLPAIPAIRTLSQRQIGNAARFLSAGSARGLNTHATGHNRQVARQISRERASAPATVGRTLATGTWTHDYPIWASTAMELGLPVSTNMPNEVLGADEALFAAGAGAKRWRRRVPADAAPERTAEREARCTRSEPVHRRQSKHEGGCHDDSKTRQNGSARVF